MPDFIRVGHHVIRLDQITSLQLAGAGATLSYCTVHFDNGNVLKLDGELARKISQYFEKSEEVHELT
jgi:hypothetical protein